MMEKKLCLTLIVFLIDSLYAEKVHFNIQGVDNDDLYPEKILPVDTSLNWTQILNANLGDNHNITLLEDDEITRDFQERLSKRLNIFLHSLRSRMPTNSGRNVRHTDSDGQNAQHDYQHYMSLLRASSEQTPGPELNL